MQFTIAIIILLLSSSGYGTATSWMPAMSRSVSPRDDRVVPCNYDYMVYVPCMNPSVIVPIAIAHGRARPEPMSSSSQVAPFHRSPLTMSL